VAQSYIFAWAGIPTPKTFVSFDYQDAVDALPEWELPVVVKKSWGASSENVCLVSKRHELKRIVEETFCQQIWDQYKRENIPAVWKWPKVLGQLWFWAEYGRKYRRAVVRM
jgi:carbamoylphosphate synthase large subunit